MNACHVPRGWRLGSLDFAEELGEDPDEVVVVNRAEDLRHERPALDEELRSKFERHEHKLGLAVGVLHPGGTDVRRTVVQNDIRLPVFQLAADKVSTLRGGDIAGEGGDAGYGLDGYEINTYEQLGYCRCHG